MSIPTDMRGKITYGSELYEDRRQVRPSNPLELVLKEIDVNEDVGYSILVHHGYVPPRQKVLSKEFR